MSEDERLDILYRTRQVLEAEVNRIEIERDKMMQLITLQRDIDRENKVFFEQEIKKWETIQTSI
jgi:hypothetical protein